MKPFGKRDLVAAPPLPVMVERPRPDETPLDRLPALRQRVLKEIDASTVANLSLVVLTQQIEQVIHEIANQDRLELSGAEQSRLAQDLANDMSGYGPLQSLLLDDSISDIMVNSPNKIYVGRRGKLERVAVRFRDVEHIAMVAQKIASQVGRRIDELSPMVDARLPDGSRVNVVFPPLAVDGPLLSIRRFSTDKLTPPDLVQRNATTAGMMEILEAAVKARLNIMISGGTGSGKTTLLNAVSACISPKERIVTIEDVAELQLKQPHVVRLETRPSIRGSEGPPA